jgi:hypothetical protein
MAQHCHPGLRNPESPEVGFQLRHVGLAVRALALHKFIQRCSVAASLLALVEGRLRVLPLDLQPPSLDLVLSLPREKRCAAS